MMMSETVDTSKRKYTVSQFNKDKIITWKVDKDDWAKLYDLLYDDARSEQK